MSLNLRQAVISNMNESDEENIRATIVDAIQSGEEKMLPGLGVLFELMWQRMDDQQQNDVLDSIKKGLQ